MTFGEKSFWSTVKDFLTASFLPIYPLHKQIELTKLQIQSAYELQVVNQQLMVDVKKTAIKFWHWVEQNKPYPIDKFYNSSRLQEMQRDLFHWQLRWSMMNAHLTKNTELFSNMWDNFPLKGVTALTVLDNYNAHQNTPTPIPLLIILSAPKFEKKFMQLYELPRIESDLTEELRRFLSQYYPPNHPQTPVKFFESAWHIKQFSGEVAFDNLFYLLKYIPVLVLEPEINANLLNLRIAFWDIGHLEYHTRSILSGFNYKILINRISRIQTLQWRIRKEALLKKGLSLHVLKQANREIGIHERNLIYLDLQEQSEALGESFPVDYIPNQACYETFKKYLRVLHCLIIGMVSDEYFFYHYKTLPKLPGFLSELTQDLPEAEADELAEIVFLHYQDFCETFASLSASFGSDLAVELALQLSQWPGKRWAEIQLQQALRLWLAQRGVTMEATTLEASLQAMSFHLTPTDTRFVEKVRQCLCALGHEAFPSLKMLLTTLEKLNIQQQHMLEMRQAEVQRIIAQVHKFNVKDNFRDLLQSDIEGPEMVVVPAGKFRMGDKRGEGSENEKPLHEVNIHYAFAIGKTPVTFVEYDRFCQLVGKSLPHDNDWGRGNRPVINVSWEDAKVYCQWLSEQTGGTYRLPSEAEWEYVCRAGSTTDSMFEKFENQFLENTKWVWLESSLGSRTRPVGEIPPNPWGLYDLRGNVWEWCEDVWHHDYQGAPIDGSAWTVGGDSIARVVRGGSLFSAMGGCCCASRYRLTMASHYVGFRVVREV